MSKITEELYISNITVRNIANSPINTPIITVVPQPGATFPYSEFSGFKIVPKVVTFPLEFDTLFFEIVVMIIFLIIFFTFSFFSSNFNPRVLQKGLLVLLKLVQNQCI